MKIGCLCVSQGRELVREISVTSYICQKLVYHDRKLFLDSPTPEGYTKQTHGIHRVADPNLTVPQRLNALASDAFNDGCSVCTVWDDDDYSPPDRLARIANTYFSMNSMYPWVAGYERGYFVNLRTLAGQLIICDSWPLWGGTLAFNRAAFEGTGGFVDQCPGYDREFVSSVENLPMGNSCRFADLGPRTRPIAFMHGKNIATFPRGELDPMGDELENWMPELVFKAVKDAQKFLIDRRVYPPGS